LKLRYKEYLYFCFDCKLYFYASKRRPRKIRILKKIKV